MVLTFSGLTIEFVLYSFIGWAYETILTSAVWGRFAERGMLHLPLCPIYGFCSLFILLIFGRLKNIPLIFILSSLTITAAELAASYLLELFTDEKLWNYSEWALNFDGRISVGSSIIFGVLAVLLVRVLHPLFRKIPEKIGKNAAVCTAIISLSAIIADLFITILT